MRLAAVMLAAGAGSRMGGGKLDARKDGRAMASHALANLLSGPVEAAVVVVGAPPRPDGFEELSDPRVRIVVNPAPRDGLSGSLRLGVAAVPPGIDGIYIALADMPGVSGELYARLAAAFRAASGARAVAPFQGGRRGNPVLLPAAWARANALGLEGDRGFGPLLDQPGYPIIRCEVADPGVLLDVDTPADLEAWRGC